MNIYEVHIMERENSQCKFLKDFNNLKDAREFANNQSMIPKNKGKFFLIHQKTPWKLIETYSEGICFPGVNL